MLRRFRRPSHATVVAYLALFIALGGASYAAATLPAGSVGTKQIRPHAVTLPKLAIGDRRSARARRPDWASRPPGPHRRRRPERDRAARRLDQRVRFRHQGARAPRRVDRERVVLGQSGHSQPPAARCRPVGHGHRWDRGWRCVQRLWHEQQVRWQRHLVLDHQPQRRRECRRSDAVFAHRGKRAHLGLQIRRLERVGAALQGQRQCLLGLVETASERPSPHPDDRLIPTDPPPCSDLDSDAATPRTPVARTNSTNVFRHPQPQREPHLMHDRSAARSTICVLVGAL